MGDGPGPAPAATVPTATLRLQNVLERAVPAAVTQLRLTGYSSGGAVLYGPQTKAKAAVMEFTQVPVSVRQVQVEYLQGETPVGLGRTQVNLVEGAVFTLSDLDFEDIEASLVGLTLEPTALTLAKGTSGRLQAVGRYSDSSVLNLSNSVTWSASNPSVEVRPDGTVLARTPGTASVTASYAGRSVTASVIVTDATVASLRFEPSTFRLPSGVRQSFVVRATMSDGSQQDVTSSVTSSVDDDEVAELINGQLVGGEPGETVLRASLGGQSAQARVEVIDAVLTRIDVSPLNPDLPLGATLQLSAVGVYSDLSTVDLSDSVTWRSQAGTLLQVSSGGLAEGLAVGTAPVTATLGETVGGTTIEVVDAVVTELSVDVSELRLLPGLRRSVVVTATYSDDSELEVTDQALYESSAPSVATVTTLGERGQIRALAAGNTTITVSFGQQETSVEVGVGSATVTGLTLGIVQLELPKGTSQTLVATAAYSDGSFYNVTSDVTWSSTDSEIAEIDALGKVTGLAVGSTSVQGAFQGRTVVLAVEVGIEPQTGLELFPTSNATILLPKGATDQLYAYALHGSETTLEVTNEASYLSSDTSVLTVSTTGSVRGVLTGVAEGNATVTVSYGGFSQEIAVRVEKPVATELTISPAVALSAPGTSRRYSVMATLSDGTSKDVTADVAWTSSSEDVIVTGGDAAIDVAASSNQTVTLTASLDRESVEARLTLNSFMYAANFQGSFIPAFSIASATGAPTYAARVQVGGSSYEIAVDRNGRYAYALSYEDRRIRVLAIDPSTGALRLVNSLALSIPSGPISMALAPSGAYAYVVYGTSGQVTVCSVDDETGALGVIQNRSTSRSGSAHISVHPSGRFAYVTHGEGGGISVLQLDTGTGLVVSDSLGASQYYPAWNVTDPQGRYLYVGNYIRSISTFLIDGETGLLNNEVLTSTGEEPNSLRFHPSGRFLYAATLGGVRRYLVESNGALTDERNFTVPGGGFVQHVVLDPSGRYLYLTTMDGEAFWYTIDQQDGSLGTGTRIGYEGLILPVFLAVTP